MHRCDYISVLHFHNFLECKMCTQRLVEDFYATSPIIELKLSILPINFSTQISHRCVPLAHFNTNTLHFDPLALIFFTGTLTYPKDGSQKGPVIVFVHGTMSSKDHNFVPDVCKKMITDYGTQVLHFCFD